LIVVIFSIVIALWYCTAVITLHRGLTRLPAAGPANFNRFTVIIAARNEENNIAQCLQSILAQSIDPSRYEIIVVNDRSTDQTSSIVNRFTGKDVVVRLLNVNNVPPGIAPKKNAVTLGIQNASNEIIVFTDADCRVQASWLETSESFFTPETGLLQGITTYYPLPGMNRHFFGLQAVDFLSHNIVAAAAIGAGMPINSNANNLAFRKTVFEAIGGYGLEGQKVVSGDDDLLLQKVWRSKTWKVLFMADPSGAVTTAATPTVSALFEQRKRWGSKTIHYNFLQTIFLAGIFLFYCTIAVLPVFSLFDASFLMLFIAFLGIKFLGELLLMIPGTSIFDKKKLRIYLLPASLLQLPVVLSAVIFGTFGTFSWKGEHFRRKAV
jgi:cellulose synthase/poly-beta-1,6-N-acetylglucosamine synthase-like glycosyltransferase